jgi:transposase
MEACATSHYWARELSAIGHEVRLMPPACVKPYVKRNKTDATDAAAIAEALTRPAMRFVAVKSPDQQAALMLHRVRELLVRQRTMLASALRAHLAEFGIIAPQGIHRIEKLAGEVQNTAVPALARDALSLLVRRSRTTRRDWGALRAAGCRIRHSATDARAWVVWRGLQPLAPQDPLDPLIVDQPAGPTQQFGDLAIAVAAIFSGQLDDVGRQSRFIVAVVRDLALRRFDDRS